MFRWIIILSVLLFSYTSYAFNCGANNNRLATEGMHKYQILKECGAPLHSQVVGYNYGAGKIRIVEEWVYIIKAHGIKQMYLLKIGGNGVVAKIEWLGKVE
jgi:hypothetical protein